MCLIDLWCSLILWWCLYTVYVEMYVMMWLIVWWCDVVERKNEKNQCCFPFAQDSLPLKKNNWEQTNNTTFVLSSAQNSDVYTYTCFRKCKFKEIKNNFRLYWTNCCKLGKYWLNYKWSTISSFLLIYFGATPALDKRVKQVPNVILYYRPSAPPVKLADLGVPAPTKYPFVRRSKEQLLYFVISRVHCITLHLPN